MDPESPTNFTTDGKVLIHFNTLEEINASLKSITVHAKQIIIKESQVTVTDGNITSLEVIGHEYDKGQEIAEGNCDVFDFLKKQLNRLSRRKRGMASNPLFIIPDFFCIFPMNFDMATLGLKVIGKIPLGR